MENQANKYDKFLWKEDEFSVSLCILCMYAKNNNTCKAFPSGIPDAILTGEHDHHTPYKGDYGIQYKPIETKK